MTISRLWNEAERQRFARKDVVTMKGDWVYQVPGIAEACRPDGPLLTYREVFGEETVVTKKELLALVEALARRVDRLEARCAELEARQADEPLVVPLQPYYPWQWPSITPAPNTWPYQMTITCQTGSGGE